MSEKYEFDSQGRMQYNPDFHFSHGKPFTESDLEYMCKYYEIDGTKLMSLALGKTEMTIESKIRKLKKQNRYEYYKNLNKYW